MKKLSILMFALLLPAFVMTGCSKGDDGGDPQIVLPDNNEKTQTAFAADETTGGFTFTAKQAWTVTVNEVTRASNVPWLRLLFGGEETYSGAAGTFDLVIELDENYSGETRTATITIKSGNDTITITVTQDGKKEDGTVPVDPGKPVPTGMRYVSRIDVDYGDDDWSSAVFEYDSNNRIVKTTADSDDYDGYADDVDVVAFSYDDAARTVTMTFDEDGEPENCVFRLNADGTVVSDSEMSYGNGTFTYADGYLDKLVFTSDEWGTETFTMTWSGGNKSRMVYGGTDEYGNYNQYPTDLTYNALWPNNPLCNLDLNAFFAPFDDGIYSDEGGPVIEAMGLLGKRSKNMISGVKESYDGMIEDTTEFTVEYDTDGFVTKVTAVYRYDDHEPETSVAMITYLR